MKAIFPPISPMAMVCAAVVAIPASIFIGNKLYRKTSYMKMDKEVQQLIEKRHERRMTQNKEAE